MTGPDVGTDMLRRENQELRERVAQAERAAKGLRTSLRASESRERRLLEVIDHMPASVFVRDGEGRFVLVNRKYEQRYAVRREAVLGKTLHEIFTSERADDFAAHDRRVLASGTPVEEEVAIDHGGQTEIHASLKFPLFDSPDRNVNIGGIEYDVTDRARAQAETARILQAIEACSDGLAFWDAENRFILANQRYHAIISPPDAPLAPGTPFEDVLRDCLKRGVFELPDDVSIEDWITERLKRRRKLAAPFEQRLGGRWFQIADRRSPDGGTLVLMTDITELKRREAALCASEEKFRRLVEGLHDQVFFTSVNLDGTIAYVSPSVSNVLGYDAEEVKGQWHQFVADEATIQKVKAIEQETLKGKTPEPYEVSAQHKNGNTRTLEIVETPAYDENGQVVAFEGIYRDVTERKKAEQALRDSEARLNAILESSPIGVTVVRGDGRFLFVNSRMTEMVGMSREQFLATPARGLYMAPAKRDEINEELLRVGQLRDREVQLRHTDGTAIWCLLSFVPAEYFGESMYFGWVHDISDRKAADAALRAAKDQAEQALANLKQAQDSLVQAEKMASLGQLTAGIAHEIKNPLNFVNNFSETSVELLDDLKEALEPTGTMLDTNRVEQIGEIVELLTGDLEKIVQHGKRADGIVKSMLLHARGDLSEYITVELNGLVKDALNLAYHGERARDKSFQVTLETDFDAQAGAIELVPQEVTRVLCNLFTNAFYAVKMRSRRDDEQDHAPCVKVATRDRGDWVEIAIRDNGIGIPEDVIEKLFTPFFTTKPTGEGTGLGLSMSYDIIAHQHGGKIDVESAPGAFTEFVIELPRHPKQPRAD